MSHLVYTLSEGDKAIITTENGNKVEFFIYNFKEKNSETTQVKCGFEAPRTYKIVIIRSQNIDNLWDETLILWAKIRKKIWDVLL